MSKNAQFERHKWTKAERQYVKGIVHNYSLQRWTDQDIVNYLREEKKLRSVEVQSPELRTKLKNKRRIGISN